MLVDNRLSHGARLAFTLLAFTVCCAAPLAHALDWTPPIDVHPNPIRDDLFPKLIARLDGNPWVLWLGGDPVEGDDEIFWSGWDGQSWSSAQTVNRPDQVWQGPVRVSTARDGGAWVFWKEPDPVFWGRYVGLASHWTGTAWSLPDTVYHNGNPYEAMNVASVSATEAWFARESGPTIVVYHDVNGQISTSQQFSVPNRQLWTPTIAADGSGLPWVTWVLVDPNNLSAIRMQYSRMVDGEWTAPELITQLPSPFLPKLVMDSSGVPWIVTLASVPGFLMADAWALRWQGTQWGDPILISNPNPNPGQSQLAVSDEPGTDPVAVWMYEYPPPRIRRDILYSRLVGGSWTPPAMVGSLADTSYVTSPEVAVIGGTIWVTYNSGLGRPYLQHVFALHSVPNTFLESVRFAVRPFSPGALLSWSSEGDRGLVSVLIRRAGPESGPATVIAELKGQRSRGGAYADRSIVAPGQYSYWMDFISADPETLSVGPQTIAIEGSANILDGAVVETRAGLISLHGAAVGASGKQSLQIFDVQGRLVRTITFDVTARAYKVRWDGRTAQGAAAATGVYFLRLQADPGPGRARKVILTR